MTTHATPVPLWTSGRSVAPGVLRLPDLPVGWADAARRCIDTWVSAGMKDPEMEGLSSHEVMRRYEHISYGDRDVRQSPVLNRCVSLYRPAVRDLLGADAFPGDVQVALRFPGQAGTPHLDGMYESGRLHDPTVPVAVLGIYLGAVTEDSGPLAYWPGCRSAITEYGRRFRFDPDLSRERYHAMLADATAAGPDVVTGGAGTAFLFAGWLPHSYLLHRGSDIRYALYVRYYRRCFYPNGLQFPNRGHGIEVLVRPI